MTKGCFQNYMEVIVVIRPKRSLSRAAQFRVDCLNAKSGGARGVAKAELSCEADSENYPRRLLRDIMYYIGLDVHKKTISYCVKDAAGKIHRKARSDRRGANLMPGSRPFPNPG